MKKLLFLITALIISQLALRAQDTLFHKTDSVLTFSLSQAIDYGLNHNVQILNGQLDIQKAQWQIWQTTAMGLPQINGNIKYQQYPDLPTQLMPNFLAPVIYKVNMESFGLRPIQPPPNPNDKIPVQFGSEYNASWGIQVSQLIFDGQYFVGLQASRIFKDLAQQKLEKTKRDLKASIEQSYLLVLIAQQSRKILEETYQNTLKLRDQTAQLVATGMGDKVKIKQMNYVVFQLKNQLKTIERQEIIARRLLKFELGLDMNDSIVLTTTLDSLENQIKLGDYANDNLNVKSTIDYRLIATQTHLAKLNLRREEAKLLPNIVGFYTYSKNAMRDEFNFFDSDQPWFKTAIFGFQVSIPIFGSGSKLASIKQKKIEYLQAQNTQQMMEQQLNIAYHQAYTNFFNAYSRYLNEKQNIDLTKSIYEDTKAKYINGSASSLELTQAQNQYLQAQGNFYQALMDLYKAKIQLDKYKF